LLLKPEWIGAGEPEVAVAQCGDRWDGGFKLSHEDKKLGSDQKRTHRLQLFPLFKAHGNFWVEGAQQQKPEIRPEPKNHSQTKNRCLGQPCSLGIPWIKKIFMVALVIFDSCFTWTSLYERSQVLRAEPSTSLRPSNRLIAVLSAADSAGGPRRRPVSALAKKAAGLR
jgi:hypothetical protein